MSTLLHLLLWITAAVVVLTAATVLAARWAWRRLSRAVTARLRRMTPLPAGGRRLPSDRAGSPGPSLGSAAAVRARAATPGAGREVAVIRRDLRADIAGAGRAVDTGRQAARPVEALDSIVRRLREQADALDIDLAVIAAEPDRITRRRLLAAQHERVTLLRQACGEVRRGVLLAGSVTTAPLLRSMVNELNEEVIALGLRARAYAELTAR